MSNKLSFLLWMMIALFILTACQKQFIAQEKLSCPNQISTKKLARKKMINVDRELKVLLSKTTNLAQYQMKREYLD